MDGEFPEQFKCPICFEIPEKEIYQCKNGHTMCDNCVKGVSLCPQCRVNLKPKNIRNRALEELLDMLKFDCSFKLEGCCTKLTRKEITTHYNLCEFGGERVPLCKNLGYSCNYCTKSRNLEESIQHMQQEHSILLRHNNMLEINLTNMKTIDLKSNCVWKPVLLNTHSNNYLLVVYLNQGKFSFSCIQMDGNCKLKVRAKFQMKSKNKTEHVIEWITDPIPQTECELALKIPSVLVSLKCLLSDFVNEDTLKIQVFMSDNNFSDECYSYVAVELDSFSVSPTSQLNQLVWGEELFTFENLVSTLKIQYDGPIGDDHHCNACRISPIVGPRYQCLQCRDYDLCSTCITKNEHSFHHFAILCTIDQVCAMTSVVSRSIPWKPYFECDNKKNLAPGYTYGSICSDAKDLHCQYCEKLPDFICLQCKGPHGICRSCFLIELERHDKKHFFVVTMTDSARQFALHLLRKHNILPLLKYERI